MPDEVVAALLGPAFLGLERLTVRSFPPIRFDERDSMPRLVARSARSGLATSVADGFLRVPRAIRRAIPRRPHETSDPVEKAAFFASVVGGAAMSNSTYRARRVGRDARALAAELEADEPRTTRLISDVLTYRRRGWRRAWRIDGPDGRLAGAVVARQALLRPVDGVRVPAAIRRLLRSPRPCSTAAGRGTRWGLPWTSGRCCRTCVAPAGSSCHRG